MFHRIFSRGSLFNHTDSSKQEILSQRCLAQVTDGCELKPCSNPYCASCARFSVPAGMTPQQLADDLVSTSCFSPLLYPLLQKLHKDRLCPVTRWIPKDLHLKSLEVLYLLITLFFNFFIPAIYVICLS